MNAADFASLVHGKRRTDAKWWDARCPAHDDRRASLAFADGDRGVIVKCHVGCTIDAIARALNIDVPQLFHANGNGNHAKPNMVATYDYQDERGELLYQVVRFEPKDFRPRLPDGRWELNGVRRVVYRLPELAEAARVYLVEGEKDADRLVSLGLRATTTAGGANAWRSEYAEQIARAGVPLVITVPDCDAPGRAYAAKAANDLRAHGVEVRTLALPGVADKGDVSDWLDAGHTADELEALAATSKSAHIDTKPEPELRREGLDLSLVWPNDVRFALTAIRDSGEGVRGELTVTQQGRRLSWGNLTLSSTQAREALRKKLEHAAPDLPWGEYLEDAAWTLTQAARQGEPLVKLTGRRAEPSRALIPGLIYESEITEIFADGDTGKSLVAAAIACATGSGVALPSGVRPTRAVPVAYLDWETSKETVDDRLGLLAAGLGIDPPDFFYRRMTRPLVADVTPLAAELAREHIRFVVVDSMMFAVAGGDGAAFHEPITAFFSALRLFAPAGVLVINHMTGADARHGGAARPFGGAFAFNGPRLIWEAKRDKDVTDATAIAFTCIKANNLPRKPEPFGLRFQPGADTITVYPLDLREAAPQLIAGASLTYRIRLALSQGSKSAQALADELSAKRDSVERLLRRFRADGSVREVEGSWELTR